MKDEKAAPPKDFVSSAIERAKQELEHMIDLNPQIMMLVERSGRITRANAALLRLVGVDDFAAVLNKNIRQLFPCKEADFFDQLLKGIAGHKTKEATVALCEEETQLLSFTAVPSGKRSGLFVVIVDNVTNKQGKGKEDAKEIQMEAVQAVVGALLHNVNQPLTVILVRSHLMRLALENGENQPGELLKNLQDIVKLTVQIGDTLKRLENPKDFVTEQYVKGVDILDVKKSGDAGSKWDTFCLGALKSLLNMLEAHETGAITHSAHTATYAAAIAQMLGHPPETLQSIRQAALFHDVGKLGIPDTVLQKPAPLSLDEKEIMKKHSEIGYMLMRGMPLLETEAETAYCHHEHFDGSGYPRGLKGEQIPLTARIVSVADSFDAIRFRRPYHSPSAPAVVIEEILKGSGTWYDPQVVDAFEKCCGTEKSIFRREDPDVQSQK